MESMIEVEGLSKSYGAVEALRHVSFRVKPGEIIGLLGPNGAGKTTLMKILTGYLHPTSGTARIGGHDVVEEPEEVQKLIGYLPENAPLYPELTVQSYLLMMVELRRIPKAEQRRRISEAVYACGLEERLTRPIGTLSKGYRQRVGLAQAILHKPKLLILDEPTNGLDPTQIVEVRHLIKRLSQSSTVLLSTHILSEVEATCGRAIIIMRGQLKEDARLEDLAAASGVRIRIAPGVETEEILATLSSIPGCRKAELVEESGRIRLFRVEAEDDRDLGPDVFRLACDNNWSLCELSRDVRTLETVFNDLAMAGGGVA